jgi:hypothetical protein
MIAFLFDQLISDDKGHFWELLINDLLLKR